MEKYKYSIDLRYNKLKENVSYKISPKNIKSIIIDRDYVENNMPLTFLNVALDKNLIDDMILNSEKNTMVLTIYKYIDFNDSNNIQKAKTVYIQSEFSYIIQENTNETKSIDYSGDNAERNDILRYITIGLLSIKNINDNKKTTNTTFRSTSMMNAVTYVTRHMKMVIEKFKYNKIQKELLIKPLGSVSKIIRYLNGINVFYDTQYRFFIDFDCAYLLSSSGKEVPKKGESINTILVVIRDPFKLDSAVDGMITDRKQKIYQIDVLATDADIKVNTAMEKAYTGVTGVNSNGVIGMENLKISRSASINSNNNVVRVPDNNKDMMKTIISETNNSNAAISVNKDNLDVSVITPNKRYIIRNMEENKKLNGDFILLRKREIFIPEASNEFICNVSLDFKQCVK